MTTWQLKKGDRVHVWGIAQSGVHFNGAEAVLLSSFDPDCFLVIEVNGRCQIFDHSLADFRLETPFAAPNAPRLCLACQD